MNKGFSNKSLSLQITNSKHFLYLFILWPFLAFITALANYSQKEARKVVYIFLIYYGLTFVIGNEGIDAYRYAYSLKANASLPFSDIFKIVGGINTSDTSVDIVEPLISFTVSRFTADYHILMAVYAAVFGFFYLRSINLLYNRYKENPGWNVLVYLAFFSVILPITSINGFRMWTAAWIFFYGAYHVVLYRNPRYLILSMASCLVHWSFLSANGVLLIYFFAGNRNLIYLPLSIVSFILPRLIAPLLQSMFGMTGGAIRARVEMYTDEAFVLGTQENFTQGAWFMQIGYDLVFYYLVLAIIVIQIKQKYQLREPAEKNLVSFLLLFLSFVNFAKEIPAFGRFQIIFFMFATLYIFLYFTNFYSNKIAPLTLIGLFPMFLYAAITFRQGSETINAWIFTPGVGLPLLVPDLSVFEILFR